jgi:hypothetical protein
MFILGLSGKKRAGKSTVAEHLVAKHGFREVSWAEPLKQHIGVDLMGFTYEQLYGDQKEVVDEFWKDTPRAFLQKIGTDLFRTMDEDFWVKVGIKNIKAWKAVGVEKIVVSDCRFPNEFKAIKDLGGFTLRVAREDYHTPDFHASETALDGVEADGTISAATGNIDMLKVRADQFLEWCRIKHDAV